MIIKALAYAALALAALNVAEMTGLVEKNRYLTFLPRWENNSNTNSLHGIFNALRTSTGQGTADSHPFTFTGENEPTKTPAEATQPSQLASQKKPASSDEIGRLVKQLDSEAPAIAPAAGPAVQPVVSQTARSAADKPARNQP